MAGQLGASVGCRSCQQWKCVPCWVWSCRSPRPADYLDWSGLSRAASEGPRSTRSTEGGNRLERIESAAATNCDYQRNQNETHGRHQLCFPIHGLLLSKKKSATERAHKK